MVGRGVYRGNNRSQGATGLVDLWESIKLGGGALLVLNPLPQIIGEFAIFSSDRRTSVTRSIFNVGFFLIG